MSPHGFNTESERVAGLYTGAEALTCSIHASHRAPVVLNVRKGTSTRASCSARLAPARRPSRKPLQQQQQPQPRISPASSATRIGAPPPTGARSLTNGFLQKPLPQGPEHPPNYQQTLSTTTASPSTPPWHALSSTIKDKKPDGESGCPSSAVLVSIVPLCAVAAIQVTRL